MATDNTGGLGKRVQGRFQGFVASVGRRLHLPNRKFLRDVLTGLVRNGSVLLSEIGRGLDEELPLASTEQRLSRNLRSERFDDEAVVDDYLDLVKPILHDPSFPRPVISVDGGDIVKPRAKAMPYLARIHDGSTGEIATGYSMVGIEAVGEGSRRLPLCARLFSSKAPEFESRHNAEVAAVDRVRGAVPVDAVWVFDRGFDGRRLFDALDERELSWIIRQNISRFRNKPDGTRENRNRLVFHDSDTEKRHLDEVVATVKTSHNFRAKAPDPRRKRSWILRVGWTKIRLPRQSPSGYMLKRPGAEYSLVIARGIGKQPLALLTSLSVDSLAQAQQVVLDYLKRWGVEEAFRFTKMMMGLEDVRALTWRGLQRMVLLSMLAYGFLSILLHSARSFALRLAAGFKGFGPVPSYLYYRRIRAVGDLLQLHPS